MMWFALLTITSLAILSITSALPTSLTARAVETCPIDALSCSPNAGGSCCSPTDGLLLLTQQWIEGLGPAESFTLHGLWPDTCSGFQREKYGCDSARNYTNVESIVRNNQPLYKEMLQYWPSFKKGPNANNIFWSHEWDVHGTCITTMEPNCYSNYQKDEEVHEYFDTALQLRQHYDLYSILRDAGIVPGNRYDVGEFETAIADAIGATPKIICKGSQLHEIWLYFNVKNRYEYNPIDSVDGSTCPGLINYFHK